MVCHGCFDIVHPGHIRYLEFARKHGDLLIVSITSDAAIDKESDRPYIPEELRAENLAALSFVDLAYVDPNHTAEQVLQVIKPDVYVKGHEYQLSKDPRFLAAVTKDLPWQARPRSRSKTPASRRWPGAPGRDGPKNCAIWA